MPSKSEKQHRFMEAVAHDPKFAKKASVPQSVGQEYSKSDQMERRGNALVYRKKGRK